MEIKTISHKYPFWLRPLQFEGTAMLPNVLLMCKLLVVLLLAHHFFAKIKDPFIPFIPALNVFNAIPDSFKISLRALLVIAVIMLFFNIYVRTAAIIIGSIVILQMLSSKPNFHNHTFICGCALFLAGLTDTKQSPYLLIIQLALVYFGASINKLTDVDWWSGAFMHNWLAVARENPFYLYTSKWFPNLWLAKFLSWTAMFTELIIGILLCTKKYRLFSVWFIIIFHTMLFTMTASRFGHFIGSLAIILIAFLVWPKNKMIVEYKTNGYRLFKNLIAFLDWDKKIEWKETLLESNTSIQLQTQEKTVINDAAIKDIILYTPAFYILFLALDMALFFILYYHRTTLFVINVITMWTLIIYFLPISWSKYFNKKTTYK